MARSKVNGNKKGKAAEREVAQLIRTYGFEARRGQQYEGSSDSPDIVHNIPGLFIEVKRREKFNLYESLEQAEQDTEGIEDATPCVLHRKNNKRWVAVLYADDLLSVLKNHEILKRAVSNDGLK